MNIFSINGEYDILLFLLCFIIVQGAGLLSSMLSGNIKENYSKLKRPKFSPPAIVFPIVWGILYTMMAYSLYRIFIVGSQGININLGLIIFYILLFLNFLWTIIFFKLKKRGLAFIEILVLILIIILTIVKFYNYDKVAAYVLVPYLLWCIYAAILNYFIYIKNKQKTGE